MTSFHKTATCAAALGLCFTGSTALADLTAQDVWADWQRYFAGLGAEITGDESMSADTLTVSDLSMVFDLAEDDGTVTVSFSQFNFTDNGDGTVTMTVPEPMPVIVNVDGVDGEDIEMTMSYETANFSMTAEGDLDELTYTYAADRIGLIFEEVVAEGEVVEIGAARFEIADLEGTSVSTGHELRTITQTVSTGAISYLVDFVDPEFGDEVKLEGGADNMSFSGSGSFPVEMDGNDLSAMIEAGFGFDGTYRTEGANIDLDVTDFGERTQLTASSDQNELRIAIDGQRMLYDVMNDNLALSLLTEEFPFPVDVSMVRTAFNLLMPVGPSDTDQPFALGLTLADLTLSDTIWDLFDPTAELPRDPATFVIDLTGTARVLFNMFDEEQIDSLAMQPGMPGELHSLNLNELTLRAVGAALTGVGAVTFDNSDLTTFDGLPAPEGSVDLRLTGADRLIDTLIDMGLLPQDQAMGTRMMMGLFAVPGEDEDTLTSTIEFRPDGQILANGQRVQ